MTIALELGCTRLTVRRARERLGINAASVGRRRGATLRVHPPAPSDEPTGSITVTGTAGQMLDRFMRESRTGGPAPTEDLLVERLRAAHDAREHGDQLAYEDALLAISSAAGLIHQHQRRLRSAA